jgi:pyrroline-5-carboxylate reductase
MKLALIGCGFMGEAMLSAIIGRSVAPSEDVRVAEINEERCNIVRSRYHVHATDDVLDASGGAEIVIFAVKPQEFDKAARSLQGKLRREQTVVSIMAGVPIDRIARALSHAGIVRVMPNTPAAVGEGISVWTATPEVDAATREQVGAILGAMGREAYVDPQDERYLDMATALSASGPGFVFMLMEAFVDAGVHIGFKRNVAERLAVQMFLGSAKYADETGRHLAQLRNEVTSPGGTTAAGLAELETAGVRGAIISAIEAAYRRSQELGA